MADDEMVARKISAPDRKAYKLHPCGKYVEIIVPDGTPTGDAFVGLCARKGWLWNRPPENQIATVEDINAYNLARHTGAARPASPEPEEKPEPEQPAPAPAAPRPFKANAKPRGKQRR
jgi:hypothetical protein